MHHQRDDYDSWPLSFLLIHRLPSFSLLLFLIFWTIVGPCCFPWDCRCAYRSDRPGLRSKAGNERGIGTSGTIAPWTSVRGAWSWNLACVSMLDIRARIRWQMSSYLVRFRYILHFSALAWVEASRGWLFGALAFCLQTFCTSASVPWNIRRYLTHIDRVSIWVKWHTCVIFLWVFTDL